jgi:hypothetical protein
MAWSNTNLFPPTSVSDTGGEKTADMTFSLKIHVHAIYCCSCLIRLGF